MEPQAQLADMAEIEIESDPSITEEYKKLSDKCDVVIEKIKTRKNKKINKTD